MAENLADLPALKQGQQVIMPLDQPIKSSGHLQVGTSLLHSTQSPFRFLRTIFPFLTSDHGPPQGVLMSQPASCLI